jgi:hypothetical protein
MTIDRIVVYDIEVLRGMFLFMAYDPQTQEWHQFGVWEGHNSLDKLYKYYEHIRKEGYYMVGFNTLSYDAQVMEYIIRNMHRWQKTNDKGELEPITNEEILALIYTKSQNAINDGNYDVRPEYRESELFAKQIDLFKIAHYDNENKRTSLKWLEYMMDMPSIEDMPISHEQGVFTPEDRESIIHYCKNDVMATYKFYHYTRGMVEHEYYKGRDQIQDRVDLINELGMPEETINYSDVKVGDELNKAGYCKLTGKSPRALYDLKMKRGPTKKFTFGECIPEYVKFTTPAFIDFYESVKKEKVSMGDKVKKKVKGRIKWVDQEFPFTYNGTEYTIARGGIHSTEKYRIIEPAGDEILMDADVGSQHPRAIAKRELYPSHLGIAWNRVYNNTIRTRIIYKNKGKTEKKYKGLAEMYKKALNAGGFGKTNERNNWQYDPLVTFKCTIGNQFEILLLIEMLEVEGLHVVSANTDGVVCLFKRDRLPDYYKVCARWEEIVGNTVEGKLEFQEYTKLVQESVNCYYAIKPGGEVKKKGRFEWEVELHMNNSNALSRIERKALCEFFTKGIPIEETVRAEQNIYMFCIGKKASKNFIFESIDQLTGDTVKEYTRILRYYVSNDGFTLLKRKVKESESGAASIIQVAEGYKTTVANDIEGDGTGHLPNINYEYYIKGAEEARDFLLNKGVKRNIQPVSKLQLSLFNI